MAISFIGINPYLALDQLRGRLPSHPYSDILDREQLEDHLVELAPFLRSVGPNTALDSDHELGLLGVGDSDIDGGPNLSSASDFVAVERFGAWHLSRTQILLVSPKRRDATRLGHHRQFAADTHAHRPLAGDERGVRGLRALALESVVSLLAVDGTDTDIDAERVERTISGMLKDREAGPIFLGGLDVSEALDAAMHTAVTTAIARERYPITHLGRLDATQDARQVWARPQLWEYVMVRTKLGVVGHPIHQAILAAPELSDLHWLFDRTEPKPSADPGGERGRPRRRLADVIARTWIVEWNRWQDSIAAAGPPGPEVSPSRPRNVPPRPGEPPGMPPAGARRTPRPGK